MTSIVMAVPKISQIHWIGPNFRHTPIATAIANAISSQITSVHPLHTIPVSVGSLGARERPAM
jgi:hypothetical protein